MRKKLDQYYTPKTAVNNLLDNLEFPINGTVLEPCNGEGAISNALKQREIKVVTNDIDPFNKSDYHFDLSQSSQWFLLPDTEWVITNPPFNVAPKIIPLAHHHATIGVIALLRLSYIEPCKNRVDFLQKYPPNQMIVTPRISFTGKGTDSTTTAWFVWLKQDIRIKIPIKVLEK